MAHKLDPTIEFNYWSEEKKKVIINYFKKIPRRQALYELISLGDCALLERFIIDIGFNQDKLKDPQVADEFRKLLSESFHELNMKRVPMSEEIREKVLRKLVNLYYSSPSLQHSNPKEEPKIDSFKKIKMEICQLIKELVDLNSDENKGNTFLYICLILAFKINSAKKLYKTILQINRFESGIFKVEVPWEQIQFILCIFVYSHDHIKSEGASLYLSVLTRNVLVEHMKNLLMHLEKLEIDDASAPNYNRKGKSGTSLINKTSKKKDNNIAENCQDVNRNCKPTNLKEVGNEKLFKSKMHKEYPNLFRDFWLVKNIYSLNIINKYIDLALTSNYVFDSNIPLLALERCLLMIGEFTKCTSESPHISEDLKDLISCLTTRDLQEYIKKVRNNLTHVSDIKFGDTNLTLSVSQYSFDRIKFDLMKVKDNLRKLYEQEKFKIICHFADNLKRCRTVEDIYKFYPDYVINGLLSELSTIEFEFNTTSFFYVRYKLEEIKALGNVTERLLVNKLLNATTGNNTKDAFLPLILKSLIRHLKYLLIIRNNCSASDNYKDILDTFLDNLISYKSSNDEKLKTLVVGIYNLMQNCANPEIKHCAQKLYTYVTVSMNEIRGIKLFNETIKKENIREKSFVEAECEVRQIFNCIRLKLTSESALNYFDDKVTVEINLYERITRLYDLVVEFSKNSENVQDFDSKLSEVFSLIGNQNPGNNMKMIQALNDRNYKDCLELVKVKHKGKKRCKYENLVRAFMKPDNHTVQAKVALFKNFLESVDFYELDNNIECVIETGYLSVLDQAFSDLEKIQIHLKLQPSDTDGNYYNKLHAANEMILLQILEVSHWFRDEDNKSSLLSLRPDVLLHCGKSLRNFLAHHDITYKLQCYYADMTVSSIATSFSGYGKKIVFDQNYFLRPGTADFDRDVEEQYYGIQHRNLLVLQEDMFTAIAKDDLISLKRCVDSGSDPKGINMHGKNALQFAFLCSSAHCFNYLVERYEKIVISSPKFENSKMCLCLDITSPSDFVKLLNMTLSHGTLKNNDVLEQAFITYDFIKKKYGVFSMKRSVIEILHILVYFNDVDAMKNACELGLHSLCHPDINGNHPLHWAAALGQVSICEILINNGVNINEPNSKCLTPLDMAIADHQWETIVFLIKCDATKKHSEDPLVLALMTNQTTWIEELLKVTPFIYNKKKLNMFLILYSFICCGPNTIGRLLDWLECETEKISKNNLDISKATSVSLGNFIKWFILCGACLYGSLNVVKEILHRQYYEPENDILHSYNASLLESLLFYNCLHRHDCSCVLQIIDFFTNNSPLHIACKMGGSGKKELVEHLMDNYIIDERCNLGFTPLQMALLYRNTEISKVLIENGADINLSTPDGITPIHISSYFGLTDILTLLINRKVELNVLTQEYLLSPFHFASFEGYHQVLQLLVDAARSYGVAECENILNLCDAQGNTALHYAVGQCRMKSVKILLENGADHRICNKFNHNCLHLVVNKGWEETFRIIIKSINEERRKDMINILTEIKNNI